jgi:hypothetical protein
MISEGITIEETVCFSLGFEALDEPKIELTEEGHIFANGEIVHNTPEEMQRIGKAFYDFAQLYLSHRRAVLGTNN